MRFSLSLIKNVFTPLTKSVLISLGLTAAPSARDAAFQMKFVWSDMNTLITSNERWNETWNEMKSLKESILLIKGVSKTFKNETK